MAGQTPMTALRVLQIVVPLGGYELAELEESVGRQALAPDGGLILRIAAVDVVRADGVAVVTAVTELESGYVSVEARGGSQDGRVYDLVAF